MANIENLRDVIERSPKLWYTSKLKITQHLNGIREEYTMDIDTIADYEKKIAKRVASITQVGASCQTTTYFKDTQCISKVSGEVFSNEQDSTVRENIEKQLNENIKMSSEDFDQLFSAKGALRPILFDILTANDTNTAINISIPNTLECRFSPEIFASKENNENVNSNIILSLCSTDTLKVNSLMCQALNGKDGLVISDTEIIIHLYDGEVDF